MKAAAGAYRSGQHGKGSGERHYLPDGKLYTGPTHKKPDGSLHTRAKHSADSQPLSHQKGGHFVRRDGTVSEKEMAKY